MTTEKQSTHPDNLPNTLGGLQLSRMTTPLAQEIRLLRKKVADPNCTVQDVVDYILKTDSDSCWLYGINADGETVNVEIRVTKVDSKNPVNLLKEDKRDRIENIMFPNKETWAD